MATWRESVAVYAHPRVGTLLALGFSAGLPFLLVFSTLAAWLHDYGVSRSSIGFFAWIGITYSIKVLWAPIVDRVPLPLFTRRLGQRRGWMLCAQLGIAAGLVGLASVDPSQSLGWVVVFGLLVAFASATQDITVDAFRIEAAEPERQAAMAASYIFGYRLALLVAGAGALYIAEFADWSTSYAVMAACMLVGIATTLITREPERPPVDAANELTERAAQFLSSRQHWPPWLSRAGAWFVGAVVGPFVDFFQRNGWRVALLLLTVITFYRLSDLTMGVMANPFYLDMGFSKQDIANVAKIFGFGMTIFGSALGGVLVVRFGVWWVLLTGAVMVALTNLLFAWMALFPVGEVTLAQLAIVISADNVSAGLANVAFIAFLSGLTNRAYTATQYALFSSLMTLLGKFVGGYSGVVVDSFGYVNFFIYAAALGLPAIALVWACRRFADEATAARDETAAPAR